MNLKNISRIAILFALSLTACAAPTSEPTIEPTTGPDLALTITAQAQALQALTQTALAPTSTPEPTFTSAPVFTVTPSIVNVLVSADTNCRSGPGEAYEIVGALKAGLQAEVIGKNSVANYWVIKNPTQPGTCWLWGEYATVIGDAASVQEFDAPPTAVPPAATGLVIDRVVVRLDQSSGGLIVYLDVYYYDAEGDANLVDFQLISTSVQTSGEIKDVSITPSAKQKNGSVVTGQWACGSKQYDVAIGVIIHDQAGHSSNLVGVNFSCNKN